MDRHRIKVTVLEDHRLEIRLPDEFPIGPAEVTVLTDAAPEWSRAQATAESLAALEELKQLKLTPEEQRILDDFESFREEHPFELSTLTDLAK